MIFGRVLANQHTLPLVAVLAAAVAGAIIGDSVGYLVGQRYGRRMLARLPHRLIKPAHVRDTEDTIRRLGGTAVFVGRFTAALRALVPGMAGMARIPYRTFLPWNVLGGATWAASFVALGYLAGDQYHRLERYANYLGLGLLAVIGTVLVLRDRPGRSPSRSPAATGTSLRMTGLWWRVREARTTPLAGRSTRATR